MLVRLKVKALRMHLSFKDPNAHVATRWDKRNWCRRKKSFGAEEKRVPHLQLDQRLSAWPQVK